MYAKDYKGFTIEVERYESVAENEMLRWAVVRNEDGYIMHEGVDYAEVFKKRNQKKAIVLQEFDHWKRRVDMFVQKSPNDQIPENF